MAGTLETLLHFDGLNGSTTFTDATGKHTWTSDSGAALDTSQSKFGTSSLQIGQGGAWGRVLGDGTINFGTGPFTIDFWMKLNGTQAGQINVFNLISPSIVLYIPTPGGPIGFYAGGVAIPGVTNFTTNVWHHVALTFDSTTQYLFLDGHLEGTWINATNYGVCPAPYPLIGQGGGYSPVGWVDELRIVLGSCDWTASFTPPTAPYPGGPTAVSLTEAGSAADAPSATWITSVSVSEAGSAADAPNATRITAVSLTEAGSAADAPNATQGPAVSLTEAGAATDTLNATWVAIAAITEAGSASDTTDATGAASIWPGAKWLGADLPADAFSADADYLYTPPAVIAVSLTEAGAASDASNATRAATVSLTEAGSAADAPNATRITVVAITEAGAAGDTPSVKWTTAASVAEAGAAVDTTDATRVAAGVANIVETGAATDVVSVTSVNLVSIVEAGSATDTPSASKSVFASIVEAGSAVDTPTAIYTASANISEFGTAADVVALTANIFNVALTEAGAANDNVVSSKASPTGLMALMVRWKY